MKTIAVIPARGGSKRLPGKNLLQLGGIPLVAHSIKYALANTDIIADVYVTTDDEEIKETAIKYGAKVIDRPQHLSGDLEPTSSALQHALEVINDSLIEFVVLLQPTNPLRPESLLREAYTAFLKSGRDSLFTVSRNHQKLGKIVAGQFKPYNYTIGQRSQDLEPLYFENGLLYISGRSTILAGQVIGTDAFPYETSGLYSNVDIDTVEDFQYAEYLIGTKLQ